MTKRLILPSATSVNGIDWRQSLKDLNSLGIKQFALFLTGILEDERPELFEILEKMEGIKIPFVHAVSMHPDESYLLINKFGAKKFNIHAPKFRPLKYSYPHDILDRIYIENAEGAITQEDLTGFAGLLIDTSHLENDRRADPEGFEKLMELIRNNTVGANHLSPVNHESYVSKRDGRRKYDKHQLDDLSELDYLKNFPEYCFGEYLAIELYNPIKEQLETIEYIKANKLVPL